MEKRSIIFVSILISVNLLILLWVVQRPKSQSALKRSRLVTYNENVDSLLQLYHILENQEKHNNPVRLILLVFFSGVREYPIKILSNLKTIKKEYKAKGLKLLVYLGPGKYGKTTCSLLKTHEIPYLRDPKWEIGGSFGVKISCGGLVLIDNTTRRIEFASSKIPTKLALREMIGGRLQ